VDFLFARERIFPGSFQESVAASRDEKERKKKKVKKEEGFGCQGYMVPQRTFFCSASLPAIPFSATLGDVNSSHTTSAMSISSSNIGKS